MGMVDSGMVSTLTYNGVCTMSTLKVGTIQDHTNSNTAISIDSSGRILTPSRPMFDVAKNQYS